MKVKLMFVFMLAVLIMPAVFAAPGETGGLNIAQSMRDAMGVYTQLKSSAKGDNYFQIAENFWKLAVIFEELSQLKAPKGSEVQWKELHGSIVKAAFLGIGACAVGDKEVIDKAVKDIGGFQREGHGEFR